MLRHRSLACKKSEIEQVVDKDNTVPLPLTEEKFCLKTWWTTLAAIGNEAEETPFVDEVAEIMQRSSFSSVMGNSTVSSLLEIMYSSSFGLNVFKKHTKSSGDFKDIALHRVKRSIVEFWFEKM